MYITLYMILYIEIIVNAADDAFIYPLLSIIQSNNVILNDYKAGFPY